MHSSLTSQQVIMYIITDIQYRAYNNSGTVMVEVSVSVAIGLCDFVLGDD